ncbi:hypothetical protein [Kitasatospora sp. NPDC017646]|uniref:hypothetical protein n=1 Tax=Kitasatospora sp. NPDC017646 TaxID=3364024 RepID=UPI0037A08922
MPEPELPDPAARELYRAILREVVCSPRGLTRRAIASGMGLGERTVAGHIARLREMYDAETLVQLGWQMRGARTGESGG